MSYIHVWMCTAHSKNKPLKIACVLKHWCTEFNIQVWFKSVFTRAGSQKGEITCVFLSLSCLNITKKLQIKLKNVVFSFFELIFFWFCRMKVEKTKAFLSSSNDVRILKQMGPEVGEMSWLCFYRDIGRYKLYELKQKHTTK